MSDGAENIEPLPLGRRRGIGRTNGTAKRQGAGKPAAAAQAKTSARGPGAGQMPNAIAEPAEAAAAQDAQAATLHAHRRLLGRLNGICGTLATRLEAHLGGAAGELDCLGERETPAHLLDLLTRSVAKLVPLERQAHNFEDSQPEFDDLSDAERAEAISAILRAASSQQRQPR